MWISPGRDAPVVTDRRWPKGPDRASASFRASLAEEALETIRVVERSVQLPSAGSTCLGRGMMLTESAAKTLAEKRRRGRMSRTIEFELTTLNYALRWG